jgi:hypothetical protein
MDQLTVLDSHVLWAFADATRPWGTTRYALLTCSEARDAAMGRCCPGKAKQLSDIGVGGALHLLACLL